MRTVFNAPKVETSVSIDVETHIDSVDGDELSDGDTGGGRSSGDGFVEDRPIPDDTYEYYFDKSLGQLHTRVYTNVLLRGLRFFSSEGSLCRIWLELRIFKNDVGVYTSSAY